MEVIQGFAFALAIEVHRRHLVEAIYNWLYEVYKIVNGLLAIGFMFCLWRTSGCR